MIAASVLTKSAFKEASGRRTTRGGLLELLGRPSTDRWKDFRESYYHEQGVTLFVLFKKSLSATTIQYAELIALIRYRNSQPS